MAALEKIRKKSVFLIVVIGVALFAFIIGDFLNSGQTFFGNATTVAKVGGEKIDIHQFQTNLEEMSQQVQNSGQQIDMALIQQRVLENMIDEKLFNKEIEKLGIKVSDEELTEYMTGRFATPQMYQFAQQMGAPDTKTLYDMLFNPSKYNLNNEMVAPAKAEWLKMEKNITLQVSQMKLANLIIGTIPANDLDVKALNAGNATSSVLLVQKPFSSVSDDDAKVSDEEINARYASDKGMFRQKQEVRRIHYITVDIKPSAADEAAANRLFVSADSALRNTAGIEAVTTNSDLMVKNSTSRLSDISNTKVKDFVAAAAVGAVSEMTHIGDTYSVVKLLGKTVEVDSILVDMVAVEGEKSVQDSILNLLKGGKTVAEIEKVKGVSGSQADIWLDLVKAAPTADVKAKLLGADKGFFIFDSNDRMAILYNVKDKKAPKTVYEYAEVSYRVLPSEETTRGLRNALNSFVANNQNSKDFAENAIKAGYTAIESQLTVDMPQIDRIPYTRKAIQWAFNAKAGEVSPIFDKENNDKMLVVTLDEVLDNKYTPVSAPAVKMLLTSLIRNDKKAEKIIADFNGKANDLNGYASVMGVQVDSVKCNFAQPFIPGAGYEPALVGAISAAEPGKLVGPVKGQNGVFYFQVTGVDNNVPEIGKEQAGNRFSSMYGGNSVMQRFYEILKEDNKVEYMLQKFY